MEFHYSQAAVAQTGVLPRRFGRNLAVFEESEPDQTVIFHTVAGYSHSPFLDFASAYHPTFVAAVVA
jgi:hypothetical protein